MSVLRTIRSEPCFKSAHFAETVRNCRTMQFECPLSVPRLQPDCGVGPVRHPGVSTQRPRQRALFSALRDCGLASASARWGKQIAAWRPAKGGKNCAAFLMDRATEELELWTDWRKKLRRHSAWEQTVLRMRAPGESLRMFVSPNQSHYLWKAAVKHGSSNEWRHDSVGRRRREKK